MSENVTSIDKAKESEDLREHLLNADNLPDELKAELAKGRSIEKYENIEKIVADLGGTASLNEIQIAYYNRHNEHLMRQSLNTGLSNHCDKAISKIKRGEKQGTYTLKT